MRQNQNVKRSRGRGRRSGNSNQNSFNRNTTFESNGPEGRLRGNAQQLFEKYTSLAHDAQSAGERVLFEANSQFADHYYRIHQSILANAEQRRQNDEKSQQRKQPNKQDADKEETAQVEEAGQEAEVSAPAADVVAQTDGDINASGDEAEAGNVESGNVEAGEEETVAVAS